MPPVASRRGRRIASKACDACRLRKVQCTFAGENAACRRCVDGGIACTFASERKQRGPAARHTIAALDVGLGEPSIDHLCSPTVFRAIIDDYLHLVYPLLPVVHRPSFRALVDANAYTSDAAFLRLCLAVCAVTVASIPRKFNEYAIDQYPHVGAMVDRACHLVLRSRISSEPGWQNRPAMSTMIVSILLAMSSHYAGRPNQGWAYASEAIQFFRALELYRMEAYTALTAREGELCKRAFWVLYIIQIHDRLSFIVPHTGLSFDPFHTDWQFLLPCQVDDEALSAHELTSMEHASSLHYPPRNRPLPIISGFVALIKVFLCVVDLLSNGFPGSPPQAYAMTSVASRSLFYPDKPLDCTHPPTSSAPSKSTIGLGALLHIIKKLQATLEELPEELKISTLDPELQFPDHNSSMSPSLTHQFDTMRANIHITSLYIQSTILEACSNAFTNPQADNSSSPRDEARSSSEHTPRTQLWMFRKSIAKELLEVLNFCSSRTLEANGSSMIVKIREIAATLLDSDDYLETTSEQEEQSRQYVTQFADILANLDYMGQATIIPPIFSAH
ncbi:hypothetical protein K458DRAFT_138954 [Lentithecium fluviatile CBS 122367]|uniref:Zn(2)-C6 fungal-type domain-containing protein n=1 Tax=Lentithecium fluviatile CBS 122367 TaxID=1168545 RepID=A0A6G1IKC7_9PLEO|nr:hypothetical protein K458DRAFT_138954 [Lentithecium fluviatile CBS 122367]